MLIESQPINIHDLAIEEPVYNVDRWFDVKRDLTPEQIAEYTNDQSLDNIVARKTLGLISELSSDQKDVALQALKDSRNIQLEILPTVEIRSKLRKLGMQVNPTTHEESILRQHFYGSTTVRCYMKIIGYDVGDEFMTRDINFLQRYFKNPHNYTNELATNKILGVPFKLDKDTINQLKKIEFHHRISDMSPLEYAANLAILACDEVKIGDNGIELHYNTSTNLNTTPSIPVTRNF